jgi:hypothetical protein
MAVCQRICQQSLRTQHEFRDYSVTGTTFGLLSHHSVVDGMLNKYRRYKSNVLLS